MNELFAKVYVETDVEHASLLDLVADAVDGEVDGWTVEAGGVEIDVRPNEDCHCPQRMTDPDDFVYFPFSLDVEAVDERIGLDGFLVLLSVLMRRLDSNGMRLVAACDWESDLPGRGRLGFHD